MLLFLYRHMLGSEISRNACSPWMFCKECYAENNIRPLNNVVDHENPLIEYDVGRLAYKGFMLTGVSNR